jgi:hypothetical protein
VATYDRPVTGADVAAALRTAGVAPDHPALPPPGAVVASLEDLRRRCPPPALGLTPGAWVAHLAPLFGEFE